VTYLKGEQKESIRNSLAELTEKELELIKREINILKKGKG
jgi:hypothetical protein